MRFNSDIFKKKNNLRTNPNNCSYKENTINEKTSSDELIRYNRVQCLLLNKQLNYGPSHVLQTNLFDFSVF